METAIVRHILEAKAPAI